MTGYLLCIIFGAVLLLPFFLIVVMSIITEHRRLWYEAYDESDVVLNIAYIVITILGAILLTAGIIGIN